MASSSFNIPFRTKSITIDFSAHNAITEAYGVYLTDVFTPISDATEILAITQNISEQVNRYPIGFMVRNNNELQVYLPYSATSGKVHVKIMYR